MTTKNITTKEYLKIILEAQDKLILKISNLEDKLDKVYYDNNPDEVPIEKRYKIFSCLSNNEIIDIFDYQNKTGNNKASGKDLMEQFKWLGLYEANTFVAFWNSSSKKNKEKVVTYLLKS